MFVCFQFSIENLSQKKTFFTVFLLFWFVLQDKVIDSLCRYSLHKDMKHEEIQVVRAKSIIKRIYLPQFFLFQFSGVVLNGVSAAFVYNFRKIHFLASSYISLTTFQTASHIQWNFGFYHLKCFIVNSNGGKSDDLHFIYPIWSVTKFGTSFPHLAMKQCKRKG